jgi:hypothetical protein
MDIFKMERMTIKSAFGGEVPFTKYIADNREVAQRLLVAVDSDVDDFTVAPEDQTVDRKRVDLVVRDSDGVVQQVIESQDATGWLDSVHASKITYYMYEKECFDGVLLTEDSDEHIKGFVRFMNENTPFNIFLVNTIIYKTPEGPYVDFIPVMRPFSVKDKKIRRTASANGKPDNGIGFADMLAEKFEQSNGAFTHKSRYYVSTNNVANTGVNVGITPKKTGYFNIDMYHGGKHAENTNFETSAAELFPSAKFNKIRGYVQVNTWEEAYSTHQQMVSALKEKTIKV